MLNEFELIYNLGWRGVVSIIDDNFIGNKKHARNFLLSLKDWSAEKNYPFSFITEASVDLSAESELLRLMVECNFKGVFLGIETPDENSLIVTKKTQNMRSPLLEALDIINRSGLSIIAGMVIGFDGEKKGAGKRITQFINQAAIPASNFGILQALPTTALWTRLEKEQRLLSDTGDGISTKPMNFTPTRPEKEIIREYIDANIELYKASNYLPRIYQHCLKVTITHHISVFKMSKNELLFRLKKLDSKVFKFFLHTLWQHGKVMETRKIFWQFMFKLLIQKPSAILPFIINCALFEDLDEHQRYIKKTLQPFA